MKIQHSFLAIAASLLLASVPAQGGMASFQSYQGYTGLINVPSALIAPEGEIELLFTDQVESPWREARRRRVSRQENYILSVGAFTNFEGAVRLTEAPGRARDLSANFKLGMPWIPPRYPQLAVGVQDIAGGAPHLRTIYAVATQQWEPFRFSLGYGRGPDRLQGIFGGVEWQLTRWLQLLAEHDTHQASAGLRLAYSPIPSLSLGLTLRSPIADPGQVALAFGLKIPLGRQPTPPARPAAASGEKKEKTECSPRYPPLPNDLTATRRPAPAISAAVGEGNNLSGSRTPAALPDPQPAPSSPLLDDNTLEQRLLALRAALAEHGFEDVRLGTIGADTFYFELENSRYNRNELDGIGVALGTATRMVPAGFSRFVFRLKNLNLPVLEISGPVAATAAYLNNFPDDWSDRELVLLKDRLQVANAGPQRPPDLNLLPGVANPQLGHTSVVIYPGFRGTVGTESGVFDYRLSARTDWLTRLWTGGTFNVRADIPMAWSENYEVGRIYNRTGHNDPVVDRVFLTQTVKLNSSISAQVGGGLYGEDIYGGMAEAVWLPAPGSHRFRLLLARMEEDGREAMNVALGSYRYWLPFWDLGIEATAGRFFYQDDGFQLEVKRFFGNLSLAAVYTDTEEKTLSLRVTFPITPRRDFKPGLLQVRGTERYGHQLNTVLAEKGGRNPLTSGIGVRPLTMVNIERALYDTGRLHHQSILDQLPRMRDANLRYGSR